MSFHFRGAAVLALLLPLTGWAQGARPAPKANPKTPAAPTVAPAPPALPLTWPDSKALIAEGVALHDKEDYAGAAARYEQVAPNDSAYAWAQGELALSLLLADKDEASVAAARRALALEPDNATVIGILGSGLEAIKQPAAARQVYTDGLKRFPYHADLWLNLGVLEQNQAQVKPALAALQRAVALQPAAAAAHRMLGNLAARQGQTAHAMLSWLVSLAVEPAGPRSHTTLVMLERLSSAQSVLGEGESVAPALPNAAFEELDQLINSKVALNAGYVSKVRFDANLVKQTQLLVEKFPLDADPAQDYYLRLYAPLVRVLRQDDNLTAFTYLILTSADNQRAAQWVKSNGGRIERLSAALAAPLLALRDQQPRPDGQLVAAWFNEGRLQGLGPGTREANGNVTPLAGDWLLIGRGGQITERGRYVAPGKRGGLWQRLRPNGSVEQEMTFAASGPSQGEPDGPLRTFHPNGQLRYEGTYRAGKLEGLSKTYTAAGKPRETQPLVGNDYEGVITAYYPDGTVRGKMAMHADKRAGLSEDFYPDGAPQSTTTYAAGERQGPFQEFYPTKVLQARGAYANDQPDGPYATFHPNGRPLRTGAYAAGKPSGTWREYYADGKLSEEKTYDAAGELHGAYHFYDPQGRPVADTHYEHGRMVRDVNFDLAGQVRRDTPLRKGRTEVVAYDLEGRVRSRGPVENGVLVGEWRRFHPDGTVREVNRYDAKGNLTGTEEEFYPNGQLKRRRRYGADEKLDGLAEEFYADGQPQATGYYQAGQRHGPWRNFGAGGQPTQEQYYHRGQPNGVSRLYENGGQLAEERRYEFGQLREVVVYDSTGQVRARLPLAPTTAELLLPPPGGGPAGRLLSRTSLHDGDYDSQLTWYHPDGSVEGTVLMRSDRRYGPYRSQYPGGQVRAETQYLNGEETGPFVNYYPNGTVQSRGRYLAGEQVGDWLYQHPNGQVAQRQHYNASGELDSLLLVYNPAGELLLTRRYHRGELRGYLSPAAPATEVALPPAAGTVEANFADGRPAARETYLHGQPSGTWTYYYRAGGTFRTQSFGPGGLRQGRLVSYWPNGKLMEEENYAHGERHGRCRYYRPDGTLEREETYCLGERRGPSLAYDARGQVVRRDVYWNGSFYGGR